MTHVLRELTRPGSKAHKKEIVEGVTILETPPMIAVGFVGYQQTLKGLKAVGTVWANNLSESFRRRHSKHWMNGRKRAFEHCKSKSDAEKDKVTERISQNADVVRLVCHTQMKKKLKHLRQKKAHVMEIQVNGGDVSDKIAFCKSKLEQEIPVSDVFGKVACIGAWHPARVSYTVARVGQNGYHHRTETN